MSLPSRQTLRITAGARVFTVLALGAPVLWYRDGAALLALLAIGVVWMNATLDEHQHWMTLLPVSSPVESALIGAICGFTVESSQTILLALAVPPFTAAVRLGPRMMLLSLSAQLASVVLAALILLQQLSAELSFAIFTWIFAGLGLGLIGAFVHSTSTRRYDELAPYLDAQRLIRQLIDISGELGSGLDPDALGGSVLSTVRDELPTAAAVLYVPRGETLMPLVSETSESVPDLDGAEHRALEAWARTETIVDQRAFAFPLGETAIIGGVLSDEVNLSESAIAARIALLTATLRTDAVHLDTALLFAEFRESATADVRKRLAREMHDGVAQDIASLGYLVDALAARPANPQQAEQLTMLRGRISRIVAEVRQSVLTLRTSIGESDSLGTAIGAVARHLTEASQIPIQVTLDERSTRLRPQVEAELFRITQEAMNNAIKHAQASSVEVHCQVHAPDVVITISDNGRGLQGGRSDSHGLKIMRERARLINADLSIEDNPTGGLVVSVRIAAADRASRFPPPSAAAKVRA